MNLEDSLGLTIAIRDLLEKGDIYIAGRDKDGRPQYKLTEQGKTKAELGQLDKTFDDEIYADPEDFELQRKPRIIRKND